MTRASYTEASFRFSLEKSATKSGLKYESFFFHWTNFANFRPALTITFSLQEFRSLQVEAPKHNKDICCDDCGKCSFSTGLCKPMTFKDTEKLEGAHVSHVVDFS